MVAFHMFLAFVNGLSHTVCVFDRHCQKATVCIIAENVTSQQCSHRSISSRSWRFNKSRYDIKAVGSSSCLNDLVIITNNAVSTHLLKAHMSKQFLIHYGNKVSHGTK